MIPLSEERQALASRMTAQVLRYSLRFHRANRDIPLEDLVSAGHEAAVVAAARHEPSLGPFEAYASKTIELAMYDLVRKTLQIRTREYDILGKLERGKAPRFDDTEPTTAEKQHRATLRDMRLRMASLVMALHGAAELEGEDEFLDRRSMALGRAVIQQTAESLGEPERTFFIRFYREDRTLEQIAAELGITKKQARTVGARVKSQLDKALRAARVA